MVLKKKYIAIIAFVIVIIAIIAAFSLGTFESSEKTEFNNKFLKGEFTGNVSKVPINKSMPYYQWSASYKDKINKIEYNMSCLKNASILIDLYSLQGLPHPEIREFNGVSWNIYSSQAVPTTGDNNSKSNNSSVMNVYICEAEDTKASYIIYIISSGDTLKCDGSMYCELYTDYIEPLLKSLSYKDNSKAPELYDILGISKSDMKELVKEIKQAKTENYNPNVNQ